jgi:hypothetical protein
MLLGSHRWHWNTTGDLRRTGKRADMGAQWVRLLQGFGFF